MVVEEGGGTIFDVGRLDLGVWDCLLVGGSFSGWILLLGFDVRTSECVRVGWLGVLGTFVSVYFSESKNEERATFLLTSL